MNKPDMSKNGRVVLRKSGPQLTTRFTFRVEKHIEYLHSSCLYTLREIPDLEEGGRNVSIPDPGTAPRL